MLSAENAGISTWSPLKIAVFRSLWLAALFSNIGTWMQDIAGAWLMTSLSPTPLMVALVQAAASLPLFLLLLPSGALADLINRRRLLILSQGWMLLIALLLSALTYFRIITSASLLFCIFLLGVGSAFTAPAWQAFIPDLVPDDQMPSAIALGGVNMNLARAIGPALAGFLIAAIGPSFVFFMNSISFMGIVVVLFRIPDQTRNQTIADEGIIDAIQSGLRYARFSPELRAVLIRSAGFFVGASALWAVFPLFVRHNLGLGSLSYGVLIGCLGIGAVTGASLLSRFHTQFSTIKTVSLALVVFALFMFTLAWLRSFVLLCLIMFIGGNAWVMLLASFNVGAQRVLPPWVRARGISLYQMTFFAVLALGSIIWGAVANAIGIPDTLMVASGVLLIGLLFTRNLNLLYTESLNLSPSKHWPVPRIAEEPGPDRGPVLVTVRYNIDPDKAEEFKNIMKEMGTIRRRDGAFRWGLFRDLGDPSQFLETFLVHSWAEHLRQHERITEIDRVIENKVHSFHIGEHPPAIHHMISEALPVRTKPAKGKG